VLLEPCSTRERGPSAGMVVVDPKSFARDEAQHRIS